MKIAISVPTWPPGIAPNGIVTYASQIVPALRGLGHEVYVLTWAPSSDRWTINLRDYYKWSIRDRVMSRVFPELASFNAFSRTIASAVRDLVTKKQLDVLEIDETFGYAFRSSRLNLLPVIVRLHGPWFLTGRFNDPGDKSILFKHREEWEGRAIQHAHFVTSPSAVALRAVKDHYKQSLKASRVIPNPITAVPQSKTWESSRLSNDSILFVGRFDKIKGGDLVLRAFAELSASYPKLTLTFVGPDKGFKETDDKILSFEEFVRTNLPESCRSRIEFCGQINHLNVMELRRKRFITLVASQSEIMPYSVLEAMSVGSPLVATTVGGIPELITDQRNGLLVPSQDMAAIVAACKKLFDEPALAVRLGRQAWHDCRELLSPEVIATQTVGAYSEAMEIFEHGREKVVS